MKYAIIADIHGNLEAFQVVLADIKAQKATHIVCLGDVVGYNANPQECLKIVRDLNIPCVKGNHDEYCSTDDALEGFNPHAADAVHWTRGQLTAEEKQWLSDLKYTRMAANFTMVHATLDAPERWGYVFDKLAAAASFPYQNTAVCFFGHTHVPSPSCATPPFAAELIPNSKLTRPKNILSTSAPSASRATTIPRPPMSFTTRTPRRLS